MSKPMLAGAACLVAAPAIEIVSAAVTPTMSDDAGPIVAAFRDHRGAAVAGVTLDLVALALLLAGIAWLALALAPRAPRAALAGGVLALAGHGVLLVANGMSAAALPVTGALDPAQATAAVKAIGASAGVSALEPLSILGVAGFVVFGLGLRRSAGAATAVALAAGSAVETAGFASGARAAVIGGFALLLAGALGAVRGLAGRTGAAAEARPGLAAQLSGS